MELAGRYYDRVEAMRALVAGTASRASVRTRRSAEGWTHRKWQIPGSAPWPTCTRPTKAVGTCTCSGRSGRQLWARAC